MTYVKVACYCIACVVLTVSCQRARQQSQHTQVAHPGAGRSHLSTHSIVVQVYHRPFRPLTFCRGPLRIGELFAEAGRVDEVVGTTAPAVSSRRRVVGCRAAVTFGQLTGTARLSDRVNEGSRRQGVHKSLLAAAWSL